MVFSSFSEGKNKVGLAFIILRLYGICFEKVIRELGGVILRRGPKLCNFVDWRGFKVVYKRYASLYFCMCIDQDDNELEVLEIIHHFVEILDRYFGSVCELDLIFNFHKAYYELDELLLAGDLQESSKKTVARLIAAQVEFLPCIVKKFLQVVCHNFQFSERTASLSRRINWWRRRKSRLVPLAT
ncbi:AP-1 complex subunit sigma-2 [Hibiscus syriacus]|uniref:Adaptor AP-1 19 kDa protein n=1 Tax=Hibiscus syriacus TaxID=106335 RepID=A0A6A2XAR3_HIBSY|nr:AP-1 complex subunit sigma-2 [Hibiscus syriacus]